MIHVVPYSMGAAPNTLTCALFNDKYTKYFLVDLTKEQRAKLRTRKRYEEHEWPVVHELSDEDLGTGEFATEVTNIKLLGEKL